MPLHISRVSASSGPRLNAVESMTAALTAHVSFQLQWQNIPKEGKTPRSGQASAVDWRLPEWVNGDSINVA